MQNKKNKKIPLQFPLPKEIFDRAKSELSFLNMADDFIIKLLSEVFENMKAVMEGDKEIKVQVKRNFWKETITKNLNDKVLMN